MLGTSPIPSVKPPASLQKHHLANAKAKPMNSCDLPIFLVSFWVKTIFLTQKTILQQQKYLSFHRLRHQFFIFLGITIFFGALNMWRKKLQLWKPTNLPVTLKHSKPSKKTDKWRTQKTSSQSHIAAQEKMILKKKAIEKK